MTTATTDTLIRQLIGGDPHAASAIVNGADSSDDPVRLVAAALVEPEPGDLLTRAAAAATTTQQRQLVAIAAAYLTGDRDLVDALVRDHLADHPGDLLVSWIAAGAGHRPT